MFTYLNNNLEIQCQYGTPDVILTSLKLHAHLFEKFLHDELFLESFAKAKFISYIPYPPSGQHPIYTLPERLLKTKAGEQLKQFRSSWSGIEAWKN